VEVLDFVCFAAAGARTGRSRQERVVQQSSSKMLSPLPVALALFTTQLTMVILPNPLEQQQEWQGMARKMT
jgi:hypothetical protein